MTDDEAVRQPDFTKVDRMVGSPDYGVAFCVSPWPDGGWVAGVCVTHMDWVREQVEEGRIDPAMVNVPERDGDTWDMTWGWGTKDGKWLGARAHGYDAAEAIDFLWDKIHGGKGDD